jgi:hypothetical protein
VRPIPEPIVWLGWRGILWIAQQEGVEIDPPANDGENQMRQLAGELRKQGIRWLREPKWYTLRHDLDVVDVRLAVGGGAEALDFFSLESWIPESAFRADVDEIQYSVTGGDGRQRQGKRGVVPDGFFTIADEQRRKRGEPYLARYLLEVDRGNHANRAFGRNKVAPYAAYIRSPEYKARFGSNAGRWLVVTTGARRMAHLMGETWRVAGALATLFYFTTLDRLVTLDSEQNEAAAPNALAMPIWWQVGRGEPVALCEMA